MLVYTVFFLSGFYDFGSILLIMNKYCYQSDRGVINPKGMRRKLYRPGCLSGRKRGGRVPGHCPVLMGFEGGSVKRIDMERRIVYAGDGDLYFFLAEGLGLSFAGRME